MSRRVVRWIVALGLIDALALGLTINGTVTYHPARGGPSVFPLGDLLGWVIVGVTSIAIVVILKESRRTQPPAGRRPGTRPPSTRPRSAPPRTDR